MKLLNCWTKTLSVGLLAATGASQVQAQSLSVPGKPSSVGSNVQAASYAASPMESYAGPAPMTSSGGYLDGSAAYGARATRAPVDRAAMVDAMGIAMVAADQALVSGDYFTSVADVDPSVGLVA